MPDDSEISGHRRRRLHALVLSRYHRDIRGRDACLRTAELRNRDHLVPQLQGSRAARGRDACRLRLGRGDGG